MRNFIITLAFISILLFSASGCSPSSQITPEMYQQLQTQLAQKENEINTLEAQKDAAVTARQEAEAELDKLAAELAQQTPPETPSIPDLKGATTLETVQNILTFYHQTHSYDKISMFICEDMASDVWNMLSTYGIEASFMIGSFQYDVSDIADSNHAWLTVEIDGQRLALETTGGFIAEKSTEPRYFKGWIFSVPRDYKTYQNLRSEYNLRVGFIESLLAQYNQNVASYNEAVDEYNAKYASSPGSTAARELAAQLDQMESDNLALMSLINEQETQAGQAKASFEAMPTAVSY